MIDIYALEQMFYELKKKKCTLIYLQKKTGLCRASVWSYLRVFNVLQLTDVTIKDKIKYIKLKPKHSSLKFAVFMEKFLKAINQKKTRK